MSTRTLCLAGTWTEGGGATPVKSPYDGTVVADVARAGSEDRERAAAAAAEAAATMAALPAHERVRILEGARELLQRRSEEAAQRTVLLVVKSDSGLVVQAL